MNNIIKAAAGKFGNGIRSLAVEQSAAKTPEIALELIIVKKQVRIELEDDDNPLSELADDIKQRGVLQPILVRPVQGGKYELVAGERRYQATKIAGLKTIPVLIKSMTDEEASEAQFIENIRRKNLTLQEEAQRVQHDLDACGGDVKAVLKKYGKPESGRAWIYKMRGLLNLSEQAQRLISENITADIEVINDIRQIEKVSSKKAKETVDELIATSSAKKITDAKVTSESNNPVAKTISMREISRKAKAEVKPSKQKTNKKIEENYSTTDSRNAESSGEIFDNILQVDGEGDSAKLEETLREFFNKGASASEWVIAISEGIRQRDYDDSEMGRLKLAAFSAGFTKSASFDIKKLVEKAKNL